MRITISEVANLREAIHARGIEGILKDAGFFVNMAPSGEITVLREGEEVIFAPNPALPAPAAAAKRVSAPVEKPETVARKAKKENARLSKPAAKAAAPAPVTRKSGDGLPTQREIIRKRIAHAPCTTDQAFLAVREFHPMAPRTSVCTQLLQLSKGGEIELGADQMWRKEA